MSLKQNSSAGSLATWGRLGAMLAPAVLGLLLDPAGAFAQAAAPAAEPAAAPKPDTGDNAWMLMSTALVLMMTIPGVFLLYGGMVRKKNVLATCMQSFAITCLVSIIWVVVGYSLAFSGDGAYVGDFGKFMLAGLTVDAIRDKLTISESIFIVYQMTFAIITPALITGAIADRMKFSALLLFITLWSILVYSPIAHWVWGGGFLGSMGVLDFAGGTVVHINAGIAGLVACLVLGKRTGMGHESMMPHNLVLTLIGASLLWVGWFGFNAGSATAASGAAGMAMLVTQVATAAAALAWMFTEWALRGKPSVLGIASGAIAGLVAITPAAGFVGVGGALVIGIAAGVICYWTAVSVKNKLGYDDSLDAFGIHGVGGIVGAILTGVFATNAITGAADPVGLVDGNGGQVISQLIGIGVTIVYTAVVTYILLKIVDMMIGLRVTPDEEREGLDLALHGESIT